jgi:hypothetical protein
MAAVIVGYTLCPLTTIRIAGERSASVRGMESAGRTQSKPRKTRARRALGGGHRPRGASGLDGVRIAGDAVRIRDCDQRFVRSLAAGADLLNDALKLTNEAVPP